MELDFEDFVEEIKFQMTEYEELTESIILEWEDRVREWIRRYKDRTGRIIKKGEDIIIRVIDEDMEYKIAAKFYDAYRKNGLEGYWKKFNLLNV